MWLPRLNPNGQHSFLLDLSLSRHALLQALWRKSGYFEVAVLERQCRERVQRCKDMTETF